MEGIGDWLVVGGVKGGAGGHGGWLKLPPEYSQIHCSKRLVVMD
jgi:hypothetical protein